MKNIVIAGGGFAGIRLARKLRKQKDIRITLINDLEDFRYSPALYRAVTGFKMGIARLPIEWMLIDSSNVSVVVGRIIDIDQDKKQLKLEDGQKIDYDEVVFALGAVNSYYGIEGLDEYSYGVKTVREAIELKGHIHDSLTQGAKAADENFVIVGAGPTGVELAGALSAYLLGVAKKHKLKHQHVKIHLVEADPRILPQMSELASRKVSRRLAKLGVDTLVNTAVQSETLSELKTSVGMIKSRNVVWAAGTQNNPFFKEHPRVFTLDKRGYVAVNKHLQAGPNIYVCGDNASTIYSGLAETAVQHANFIAKDIMARIHNTDRPKHYEKASMQVIPVGSRWAVFQYRSLVLSGRLVSLIRRVADISGYTDVLGPIKAMTVWANSDRSEDDCPICGKSKR
jgi:NADH dehydrogenase